MNNKTFYLLTGLLALVIFFGVSLVATRSIKRGVENLEIERTRDSVVEFVKARAREELQPADFASSNYRDTSDRWQDFFRKNLQSSDLVRIKVWDGKEARVLYSDEQGLIGKNFPANANWAKAIKGEPAISIKEPLNNEESFIKGYSQLMEVYVPVDFGEGPVGSIETYYKLDRLNAEVAAVAGDLQFKLYGILGVGLFLLWGGAMLFVQKLTRDLLMANEALAQRTEELLAGKK